MASGSGEASDGGRTGYTQDAAGAVDQQSDESIYEVVDHLNTQRSILGASRFKELEQMHGWNHDPHGLLMDMSLRGLARPTLVWFDAMHCLFSNGLVHSELGHFVWALRQKGITWEQLQSFSMKVSFPSAIKKPPEIFFSEV